MPYSGVNDADLPAHVKKMPISKRRQWIAVFEDILKSSGDEGQAMAGANAAVKRVHSSRLFRKNKYGR